MEKKTTILMPVIEQEKKEKVYYPSGGAAGATQMLDKVTEISMEAIQDLVGFYNGYELDTIELHVKGAVKSGPLTQLVVGLSGEAGMKLTLKKKKDEEA
ncbi:hypothetical protein [Bacillus cereus]|uniref:hypothetical protein n=1 Tax=Bacillus cereus TaxID=1396 RepID=UPI000BFBC71C|nr:hypothetical protein [Bacillus cereus]MCU4833943.1 hypothetical protein [Bacillus cereus]PGZ46167.1 hypothetical protein COE57_27840 [Bacillus cereus]